MQIDWMRWVGGALVLLVAGGWFLYTEGDDLRTQATGYSLSKTLPKVIDAEGGDARVVSMIDRGRRWAVGSYEAEAAAIADLDGSDLHRAEPAAERALARSVASDPGR
jgi:hypothetical protein